MNERPGTADMNTVNASGLIDGLVIGGLALITGLGIWLLAPAQPAMRFDKAPSISETATSPDFYPWQRPASPLPEPKPQSTTPLRLSRPALPSKHRATAASGFLTRLTRPLNDSIFQPSDYSTEESFYGGAWSEDNIAWLGGATQLDVRRLSLRGDRFTAA